jgi:hypothetical protein
MENLLKKKSKFQWNEDFQKGMDTLKQKMVTMPILIFLEWNKKLHVHVDALSTTLGTVLSQPREHDINNPIAFESRKLSTSEKHYTTT